MNTLSDRMKENYEKRSRTTLLRRTPAIIRVDGKAFHTLTSNMKKPFDDDFIKCMNEVAIELCRKIQGAKCAYVQSDEVSVLLTDYDKLTTDAWFNYQVQKMCSVSASIAANAFNNESLLQKLQSFKENDADSGVWETQSDFIDVLLFSYNGNEHWAEFDSRCFNVPREEVNNYFIWRQRDCIKNSITMVAQSYFSDNQLRSKTGNERQEMLFTQKGVNWNNFESGKKRGRFVVRGQSEDGLDRRGWKVMEETPEFSKNPEIINDLITFE